MVRKLSLAIALALGVTPFAVNGLGLGDIKTRSGLNQQFEADIELLSVRNEEIGDIRVTLASEEAFTKAGVNRPYFLSQLKFKPVLLPNGKGIIRVTSSDPVREPFLNFLIEMNWPKGRLFREFTVLLDPPVTLQRRPSPVQSATTTGKAGPVRSVEQARVDGSVSTGSRGSGEYGPTHRNDTLWKIAAEVRHAGTTMEQMMMAMFQANPQAFIKRNINNLKVGEILRIPERDEVLAMTASEARSAFRDQVENWRVDRTAPVPEQQPQETVAGDSKTAGESSTTPVKPDETAVPEAELKIARMRTEEEAGKSIADSVDQKESSAGLTEDLLEAREMRESALEESKQLKNQVENLASQLEDLQRLLVLKDEQLAKLQIALGEEPVVPVVPAAEKAAATDSAVASVGKDSGESSAEPAAGGEVATVSQPEIIDSKTPGVEMPRFTGLPEQKESAAAAGDEAKTTAPEVAEKATVVAPARTESESVTATVDKGEIKPPSKIEPESVQKPEAGFLEKLTSHPLLKKITSDPTMMAIGGGVIAVLFALIWLLSGRKRGKDKEFQESILMDTIGEKEEAAALDQTGTGEPDSRNTEETSFLSDFSPSDIDVLPEETGEVDPMAEADVYIAYGRYGQAEELVRQGLERNPRNQELKLKLFEILYATKNIGAFTALAEAVKAEGLPETDPGAWESVATMGTKLVPGNALFTTGTSTESAPEQDSQDEMKELNDLDLGDLAASLDLEDESKEAQAKEISSGSAEVVQKTSPPVSSDSLSQSEAKDDNAPDLDNLGDELASLDSALEFDLDETDSGRLDLEKIAEDAVTPAKDETLSLDLPSLDMDMDLDAAKDTSLSLEGVEGLELDTQEVERLELPEVDELSAESAGEFGEDTADSSDEVNTKLDLARAYLEMGDEEGARSILQEVVNEGSEQQKLAAQKMMSGLS